MQDTMRIINGRGNGGHRSSLGNGNRGIRGSCCRLGSGKQNRSHRRIMGSNGGSQSIQHCMGRRRSLRSLRNQRIRSLRSLRGTDWRSPLKLYQE